MLDLFLALSVLKDKVINIKRKLRKTILRCNIDILSMLQKKFLGLKNGKTYDLCQPDLAFLEQRSA